MLETALETNHIKPEDLETLQEWRKTRQAGKVPITTRLRYDKFRK